MGLIGAGAKLLKSKVVSAGARRAAKEGAEGALKKEATALAAERAAKEGWNESLKATRQLAGKSYTAFVDAPVWKLPLFKYVPISVAGGVGVIIVGAGIGLLELVGLLDWTDNDTTLFIPNEWWIYGGGTIITIYLIKSIAEFIRARNETKLIDKREERLIKAIPPTEVSTPMGA